ncbi:DUF559 domain-containing protein [Selenomonas bovis]|uniref:DUF559 domain-containing protein n=1 Tax=Selenomonas bovis TaxID=416586 RepID=UPI001E3C9BB0|nr:DUF559 domain-containing protein [Selenomonas bovis]
MTPRFESFVVNRLIVLRKARHASFYFSGLKSCKLLHYDERGLQYDAERTKVLEGLGIYVLRFTNLDVHRNFRAVCERIIQVAEERCGHLPQT